MKYVEGTVIVGLLDNGNWRACFGLSYRDLFLHDAFGPQMILGTKIPELRKRAGADGIAAGRNEVVEKFLDGTEAEWLWFVDTDMGFPADVVTRLVKSADRDLRPVVGGLYFANTGIGFAEHYAERFEIRPQIYAWREIDGEAGFVAASSYPADQVIEVAGTGAGCLLIHRAVLEAMRLKHGPVWFDHVTHPSGKNGVQRSFSEDLSFCIRAAGLDVPIHVDTAVKATHDKGGVFADEEMFARQQVLAQYQASIAQSEVGERDEYAD